MAAPGAYHQKDWEEWGIRMSWNKRIPWKQRMMRWVQVNYAGTDEDGYEDTLSVGEAEENLESVLKKREDGISVMGGDGGKVQNETSWKEDEKISEERMENDQEEDDDVEGDKEDDDKIRKDFELSGKEDEKISEEDDNVERDEGDVYVSVQTESDSKKRLDNNQYNQEVEDEDGDNVEYNNEDAMVQPESDSSLEENKKLFEGKMDDNVEEGEEDEDVEGDVESGEVETESDSSQDEGETPDGRMEEKQEEEGEEQQIEQLYLENPFMEEMGRLEEDETETDDEDSSDKSEDEIRLKVEDDSKKPDDLEGASGSWTFQESAQSEQSPQDETDSAELWSTEEELDDEEDLQEEELEDDVEAEFSLDEETKIYKKDGYPAEVFSTLNDFRKSSLLTDLTLSTADGNTFNVHATVLAAVSSLVRRYLSRNLAYSWSRILDPEVDGVGLEAIIEFAYTGSIFNLNRHNIDQIRTAAQTLEVSRVLAICHEEEKEVTKPADEKTQGKISAKEQLIISFQSIQQLWEDGLGCDIILDAVRASLNAHRAVLAVSSDYFRSMFTLGMKESHQRRVLLPYVLSSELKVLISCSYSGELPLCWGSIYDLTITALQLQYQPALSLCLDFLRQELDPNTCLDVRSFAEALEVPQLLQAADDFVLRQFQKVAGTPKFKDLPGKQLIKYLRSHALCVSSELVVFYAVVTWIQAKPKARLKLAKALMKTIHFPLMTFKEFKEVQIHSIWYDHSLKPLYETIFADFCSNETTRIQNQCRVYLPKESLVLIGGDQITDDLSGRSISKDLWFGNSLRSHTGLKKAMEWRRLDEMSDARFGHEVAVLNGKLYLLGGKNYYGNGDILNSVYRFDPHLSSWERLADMLEKRSFFSVIVLDDKIYAIGGNGDPDYSDTVERYCTSTNSWSFTWPLDLRLSGHVAKVLQGHIFVSGGQNSDYLSLSSMFLYHPETGSTYLANMARPRAHHCMEILGESLYVAGGVTTVGESAVADLLSCEVYNPTTDNWTGFTPLPVPHVGAGSVVMEGKFYVLGGYSQEDYSDTKTVHRYDSATQRWENMGRMPGPNNDIRACLLCLPQHLRS